MPFRSLDDLITDITDTMLEVADSSNDPIVAYENLLESLPRIIRLLIDGVLVNSGDSVKISLVNGLATRVRSQIMTRIRIPAERHTLVDPATLTVPLRSRHHWIHNMGQTTLCTCGYCSLEIEEGEVANLRDNPCPGRRIDYAPEIEIKFQVKKNTGEPEPVRPTKVANPVQLVVGAAKGRHGMIWDLHQLTVLSLEAVVMRSTLGRTARPK